MKRPLAGYLVAALLSTPTFAADFYPISSVTSSTQPSDLYPAANLIQGGGVGFDASEPHAKLLTGAEGNWVTDACGFPCDYIATTGTPVITLDLGADKLLGEVSVWGYTTSNSNGVKQFSLKFATDAEGTGGFGSSISYNPTFDVDLSEFERQSRLFDQTVTARYVELTALDNYFVAPGDGSGGEVPGGDRVGLGEIAFAVVPEPSGFILFAIGLLPFCRGRRRVGV